jgi:hypothetical protein
MEAQFEQKGRPILQENGIGRGVLFIKGYAKFIFINLLILNSIILLWIFFTAYVNNYKTLVTINDFGEANIELFIFLLNVPIITYMFFNNLKETYKEKVLT